MSIIELTGTVLKNRYCILEQIGKGGNGRVYLARDMELGILRAVKELPLSGKREARLWASLEHHALPKMVDYEENSQNCYIVMEYIKGETLGEVLRKASGFTGEQVIELGISLTQLLGYLHSRRPPIFYGDLKPDNLMLSETGKLYLIDFGSAVAGYEKKQSICMGTEGFAAPEQYQGRISAASDVYGLGKTLMALLGKKRMLELLCRPGLAFVLLRCVRKEERFRYQEMEALEKKLGKVKKARLGRIQGIVAGSLLAAMVLGGLFLSLPEKKQKMDFYDKLTVITDLYHCKEFRNGTEEEKQRLCEKTEAMLLKLLKEYSGKQEYRILMNMLVINREYAGDLKKARQYYRQFLKYDEHFRAVYGEYGMFLLRTGKGEASRKLWKTYLSMDKRGELEDDTSWNLELWKREMSKEQKKRK